LCHDDRLLALHATVTAEALVVTWEIPLNFMEMQICLFAGIVPKQTKAAAMH
jgi:hypothetical protein